MTIDFFLDKFSKIPEKNWGEFTTHWQDGSPCDIIGIFHGRRKPSDNQKPLSYFYDKVKADKEFVAFCKFIHKNFPFEGGAKKPIELACALNDGEVWKFKGLWAALRKEQCFTLSPKEVVVTTLKIIKESGKTE